MSRMLLELGPQALALVALSGLIVIAISAASSRALFGLTMFTACFAAIAAMAALALNAPYAALTFALIGVGHAPLFLLGASLLSARAARARRGRAVATPIALAIIMGAVMWGARDVIGAPAPARADELGAVAIWIAVLIGAAGFGAFALLAFGERGGFERSS